MLITLATAVVLIFFISHLFVIIISVTRIGHLTLAGQNLSQAMADARDALQQHQVPISPTFYDQFFCTTGFFQLFSTYILAL